ncbi:phosphatase PAP2 family protein [Peribacillus sp. SCS-155]|uniref:phosphatase PAP2 family protein n=1 Tax=Peribacillus sedimenti TaxID=3115297 RepID=UPI003905BA2A
MEKKKILIKSGSALILISGVTVFMMLLNGVQTEEAMWLDTTLQRFFYKAHGTFFEEFFAIITELGSAKVIGIGSLLLLLWIWIRRKDYAGIAIIVLGIAGGDQLNNLLKEFVARERPNINPAVDAEGFSFPSGHAMVGIIFYVLLAFFISKYVKSITVKRSIWSLAIFLVLLIGISRIVVQAHYPSDVVGGYAIGSVCIIICLYIYWMTQHPLLKVNRRNSK